MGVVWIASYPKSGNTWVRFLLAGYLGGKIQSTAQVSALVPDLHQGGKPDASPGHAAYLKTHLPWSARHPYAAETDRAVVVVRHPKDVALSSLNYHRLSRTGEHTRTDQQYIAAFIERAGDAQWLAEGYGTLEQHTQSWLDNPDAPPHLVVRYESLKADAAAELTRILAFLALPAEPARIAAACSQATFDAMRALEVRERLGSRAEGAYVFPRASLRAGKTPRYFMNQGKARASLAHINPDLDAAFDRRFSVLLQKLGYDRPAPHSP